MSLPETFLGRIGSGGPFLIEDGKLSLLDSAPGEGRSGAIDFRGIPLYKGRGIDVERLLDLYAQRHEAQIARFQEAFVQEFLQGAKVRPKKELDRLLAKNNTVNFIINEVFPYFLEDDSAIADVLKGKGDSTEMAPRTIEELLDRQIDVRATADLSDLKDRMRRRAEELTIGTAGANAATTREHVRDEEDIRSILGARLRPRATAAPSSPLQRLEAYRTALNGRLLCFLGNVYTGPTSQYAGTLQDYENGLRLGLERTALLSSIDKCEEQLQQLAHSSARTKAIDDHLTKGELFIGDIGIIIRGGAYYAALKVPPYVMKHPTTGALYKFPACTVAVSVSSDGYVSLDGPFLREAISHPFLRYPNEFGTICMGNYQRRGRKDAEKVVNLLSDAKNVIMRGYGGKISPYHPLENFRSQQITQQDMEKEGLTPANIWR